MRTVNFLFLTVAMALTGLACKETPVPEKKTESAEPARQQAPESLNALIGGKDEAPAAKGQGNAPALPPGHPPISHGSQGAAGADYAKVHASPSLPSGHPPLPAGHPPIQGSAKKTAPAPTAETVSLRPTGSGSQAELARIATSFTDSGERAIFEKAFTNVFNQNRALRNPVGAEQALLELAKKHPKNPAIYRVLGYAAVDNGFQMARAIRFYEKAVELSPDYAEVHYALAFMYAMGDRAKGAKHFKLAMDLGMKDERGIGPRFYPTVGK